MVLEAVGRVRRLPSRWFRRGPLLRLVRLPLRIFRGFTLRNTGVEGVAVGEEVVILKTCNARLKGRIVLHKSAHEKIY